MKKLIFILLAGLVVLASCASNRVESEKPAVSKKKNSFDEKKYASWILHETEFDGATLKVRVPDENWVFQEPKLKISSATVVAVIVAPENIGNVVVTSEPNVQNLSMEDFMEVGLAQLKLVYPDLKILERQNDSYSFVVTQYGKELKMRQKIIMSQRLIFCITQTFVAENASDIEKVLFDVVEGIQVE
ncbi:hypothetical protein [Treponema zioleckii]|uniref:hypothetical protein n=1 Tax=Treponema zioleckii TaxID=331680 RepID=UPI00168B3627|nr:hypothetical protein [Treponema zioleckii]